MPAILRPTQVIDYIFGGMVAHSCLTPRKFLPLNAHLNAIYHPLKDAKDLPDWSHSIPV
jgi:hypothetical protein